MVWVNGGGEWYGLMAIESGNGLMEKEGVVMVNGTGIDW